MFSLQKAMRTLFRIGTVRGPLVVHADALALGKLKVGAAAQYQVSMQTEPKERKCAYKVYVM